jgi:hypothetical protein
VSKYRLHEGNGSVPRNVILKGGMKIEDYKKEKCIISKKKWRRGGKKRKKVWNGRRG